LYADGSNIAYRTAHCPIHPDPLEPDPRLIYHSLWPSPALFPVPGKNDPASVLIQKENEAAYRQLLVQGILAILLPTEDFQNDSLTSLVGQILSEMILGNGVGGKACEPWLIWEGITKIAEVIQTKLPESKARKRLARSLSEDKTSETLHSADQGKIKSHRWTIQKTFWLILQYGFFAFTTVRFVIVIIAMSSSLPSRLHHSKKVLGTQPVAKNMQPPASNMTASSESPNSPLKRPILSMKIWACASNLLDLDARMPWLSATLSMLQWFALQGLGELGYTDGMIDKYVSQPPYLSHPPETASDNHFCHSA
jgi:PXA domain